MRALSAFMKKEWLENIRSGKIILLLVLFLIFGIMNPAIAKLTPWMMELMADSLYETGLVVTEVQVDALTSWTQFFKNIPIALIVFVLIYSSSFTREYQSGTLTMVLTKGLSRYKVIIAKSAWMIFLWSVCYWLCFSVTYGYNAWFWDNSIAIHLLSAAAYWWLFGVWIISVMILFSVIFSNHTEVLLGTGGMVLAAYLTGMLFRGREFVPTMLMDASPLLVGQTGPDSYVRAVGITIIICMVCIAASIPLMNRKQL